MREASNGPTIYEIGAALRYTPINSSFSGLICLKKYASLIISTVAAPTRVVKSMNAQRRRLCAWIKYRAQVANAVMVKPSMSSRRSPILSAYFPI